jgi:hypothetical protein
VEDLTEREYPNFLNDAGKLLCTHFRYVSGSVDSDGSGGDGINSFTALVVPEGSLGFDVPQNVSDNHLKRLLQALKRAHVSSSSRAVATVGKFVDTGLPRTNREGLQDDITDVACPNCTVS